MNMTTTSQKIDTNNDSVLLNIEKIAQQIEQDDIQNLMNVIDKEIGDRKLDKEEIEQLQTIMNVDALEGVKWKNVADVLKYLSVFAIAENNPETVKKIFEVLLGVVGLFYPVANSAQGLLAKVPDKMFSALIKIGGFASPEYLIYKGVNFIANKKSEKAKVQAEYDRNGRENMATLIIVCKNKMLSTEMSKLINLEDDLDDETIVGTKDGTVHTIIWNESAWEAFRDKLTSNDRVLIIGKIKNTTPLTSEQIRFEKFGVKYGWNNNIAMIESDPGVLSRKNDYNEFISALNALQISEDLKKKKKWEFDWIAAGKLVVFPPLLIGDMLREDTEIRKQQLAFGLCNLYMRDLVDFLNSEETL